MFKKAFWGKGKTQKRTTALPLESKVCSTCFFWAGSREIKSGAYIEIHPYSKGQCQEGAYKHLEMGALRTCHKWEPWPAIGSDRCW